MALTMTTFVLPLVFLCGILRHGVVTPSAIRPVDYTAVLNPCRPEDYLCSSKCVVMKMKGDFSCEFCVCSNRDYYVTWDTTQDPLLTTLAPTSQHPGVIYVNNIKYIKVQDYCDLGHDHMCPSRCDRLPSVLQNGTACTKCDCRGVAVMVGK